MSILLKNKELKSPFRSGLALSCRSVGKAERYLAGEGGSSLRGFDLDLGRNLRRGLIDDGSYAVSDGTGG